MARDTETLKRRLESTRQLPTLPEVLQQIISIVTDPSSTVQALSVVIEKDQSLTAKVLRMVNSAFYGFYRQISNISDAVVILGYNEIRILALTITVFDGFGKSTSGWNRTRFWEHCLAVGMGTEILAGEARLDAKEAFVAGLLHDLGKVALDDILGPGWNTIVQKAQREDRFLIELEMEELGFTHGEAGEWVANRWHLPERIIECMRNHHHPELVRKSGPLCAAVQIANEIAKKCEIGSSGNPRVEPEENWAVGKLRLKPGVLEKIVEKVAERSRASRAALGYVGSLV